MSDLPVRGCSFDAVPLLSFQPGKLTAAQLKPVLRAWVCSPPLRALAHASGWDWPSRYETTELLTRLNDLSGDWDFRGRNGATERHLMGTAPAVVNGRVVAEKLITAAAAALGLVQTVPPPGEQFTHLVLLAGQVRACINRLRHATSLLDSGLRTRSIAVLCGHRELAGSEPQHARELGLGDLFDESDAVVAATRQTFGLTDPEQVEDSGPRLASWDNVLWSASARFRWKEAEVIVVPSSEPTARRVNTADQLRYWADAAGISNNDRVLLLTTQIYVPFQQFVGLRLLGLERGCSVYCCGVDADSATLPLKAFSGRDYLQEIRSALLAAGALMAAAQQAGG